MRELAALFLRLGATAFGGPAAHIALMEREVVERRKWIDRTRFAEMVGVTNLIPGPNSTELAIEIGRARAGVPGMVVAGLCFIAPAMLLMLGLAWLYVSQGTTVAARSVLSGVEPVVAALIAHAVVRLARTAAATVTTAVVAVAALALVMAGVNELLVLAMAGVAVFGARRSMGRSGLMVFAPVAPLIAGVAVPLQSVFLLFLKFGATVFGSGYVLIAFLRGDLVERLGWLSEQQLIDAIAAGQVTAGPVFTTATFVGYLVGGLGGALVATAGIFLPGFLLIALMGPIVDRLRRSASWRDALAGLSAGAVGLMGAVAVFLARATIGGVFGLGLLVGSLVVLVTLPRVNPIWLLAIGAVAGWINGSV